MILYAIILFVLSLLLSAFSSGIETGFFRSSRVRWVLDGIEGDSISKYLLRHVNNPSLYVGTSLIGNNIANYLISLSVVVFAHGVAQGPSVEFIAPILITPIVFVYGELLPKSLFYLAPNRLLRKCAPLYLILFVLFSPLVAVLWALARLLEWIVGQSPEKIRLTLARKELEQMLQEGQEAGLLQPVQRKLAQNFFNIAAQPVGQVCLPLHRVHSVQRGTTYRQALGYAQRYRLSNIVIYGERPSDLIGYVRTIDLLLAPNTNAAINEFHPLLTLKAQEHAGEAIMRMETKRHEIAQVVNDKDQALGIISISDLTDPLLNAAHN